MFPSLFNQNEDNEILEYILRNEKSLKKDFNTKLITLEKILEVISEGVKEAKKQKIKSFELLMI